MSLHRCAVVTQRVRLLNQPSSPQANVLNGYDPSVTPSQYVDGTNNVQCGVSIEQLGNVDEKDMSFVFSGWLHSQWIDSRLTSSAADFLWLKSVDVLPGAIWDPLVSIVSLPDSLKSGHLCHNHCHNCCHIITIVIISVL